MTKKLRIKKVIYQIFYKGKTFAFPVYVSTGITVREQVSIPRKLKAIR